MVGDSIIDIKKLEANARKYTLGASSFNSGPGLKRSEQGSTTKATNLKVHAQEANLMAEIDSLLSKKSAHSTEADEEWFANYSNRLDKLAKEEYKANMKANLAFIKVSCLTTGLSLLSFLMLGLCVILIYFRFKHSSV